MTVSDDDLSRLLSDEPSPTRADVEHDALTDLRNADALLARHGENLRYCWPWSQWLTWAGGRWQQDTRGLAEHATKQTIRLALQDAALIEDDRRRKARIRDIIASEKAARLRGCLDVARSEPAITVLPEDLDQKPWLLNTLNGTIDLATGQRMNASRADLITKQAPVHHDPAAQAPLWDSFLRRILPDEAIRRFLQRAAGYSLVGGNPAQIILILWGGGSNGKSTWVETIRACLGDYGQQAPAETFLERAGSIPNDVARLRGARFVAASELSEGKRLNEPLVKRMTGGDTMVARFMRAEYFEFQPQFTPWLATNHQPEIRGADEAIWRRIRLIPFLEFIPPGERDPDLKAKLAAELPGILNWLLDGCLAWQADGLDEPPAVLAATAAYRAEQDFLGAWLEDTCQQGEGYSALSADLYRSYHDWAQAQGEKPLEARVFGRRLGDRGFAPQKTSRGRCWLGLKLLGPQQDLL